MISRIKYAKRLSDEFLDLKRLMIIMTVLFLGVVVSVHNVFEFQIIDFNHFVHFILSNIIVMSIVVMPLLLLLVNAVSKKLLSNYMVIFHLGSIKSLNKIILTTLILLSFVFVLIHFCIIVLLGNVVDQSILTIIIGDEGSLIITIQYFLGYFLAMVVTSFLFYYIYILTNKAITILLQVLLISTGLIPLFSHTYLVILNPHSFLVGFRFGLSFESELLLKNIIFIIIIVLLFNIVGSLSSKTKEKVI